MQTIKQNYIGVARTGVHWSLKGKTLLSSYLNQDKLNIHCMVSTELTFRAFAIVKLEDRLPS